MRIEFERETSPSAKTPEARQRPLYLFDVGFTGFIELWNRLQAFFWSFFRTDTNYTESRRDVEY